MFDIEEFKSRGLALGGARPNQFYVDVVPPASLNYNTDTFRFVCRAATIPPEIVQSADVPYFGRTIRYAGDREFPDWTVTVMNDADFAVRKMLQRWSQAMNYHISNVMDSQMWPTTYKQAASVTQMRQDGATIGSYTFYGLFPLQVDPIPLDWEIKNQIENFEVTFAYDYWIYRDGESLTETSVDGTAESIDNQ